jgi:Cellulose binding domain
MKLRERAATHSDGKDSRPPRNRSCANHRPGTYPAGRMYGKDHTFDEARARVRAMPMLTSTVSRRPSNSIRPGTSEPEPLGRAVSTAWRGRYATAAMNDSAPGRPKAAVKRPELRPIHFVPWLLPLVGVCLLTALLIATGLRFANGRHSRTHLLPLPSLPAAMSDPVPTTSTSAGSPSPSAADDPVPGSPSPGSPSNGSPSNGSAAPPVSRSARPTTHRTTAPAPPPAPATVTGRYLVLNSYQDAFIAEVLVGNVSDRPRNWTVQLDFPGTVGTLVTSWVESAPQATLKRVGTAYRWTAGVPVEAHSSVALRFHFKRSGTGNLPLTCAVNGTACAGVENNGAD